MNEKKNTRKCRTLRIIQNAELTLQRTPAYDQSNFFVELNESQITFK